MLGERWNNSSRLPLVCICLDDKFNATPLSKTSKFFFIKIAARTVPRENSCPSLLGKINAQIQHLINISLQRAFIARSTPPSLRTLIATCSGEAHRSSGHL